MSYYSTTVYVSFGSRSIRFLCYHKGVLCYVLFDHHSTLGVRGVHISAPKIQMMIRVEGYVPGTMSATASKVHFTGILRGFPWNSDCVSKGTFLSRAS